MYKKILVPVDGSDQSNSGLLEAISLAKILNAQLRLLHVVDMNMLDPGYGIGAYAGDFSDVIQEAGKKILHDGSALVRQFGLEPEAIAVDSLEGNVASAIVEQAKIWGAALIVMGTHGRRGLERLALGSDAENVVRTTRIPVLLIHDGAGNTPDALRQEREVVVSNHSVFT